MSVDLDRLPAARRLLVSGLLVLCTAVPSATVYAQTQAAASPTRNVITRIKASDTFKQAAAFLDRDYDRFVQELITLTEIPAPPFKEEARGTAYVAMLKDAGGRGHSLDEWTDVEKPGAVQAAEITIAILAANAGLP